MNSIGQRCARTSRTNRTSQRTQNEITNRPSNASPPEADRAERSTTAQHHIQGAEQQQPEEKRLYTHPPTYPLLFEPKTSSSKHGTAQTHPALAPEEAIRNDHTTLKEAIRSPPTPQPRANHAQQPATTQSVPRDPQTRPIKPYRETPARPCRVLSNPASERSVPCPPRPS